MSISEADRLAGQVAMETILRLMYRPTQNIEELDKYIKSFNSTNSIYVMIAVLRSSFRARDELNSWKPLLEIALQKWPDEKKVFRGLN